MNPFLFESGLKNSFDYFPASAVFENMYRIYTGCGYNYSAEDQQFPEKHICLSFPKNYDEQNARLNDLRLKIPSSTDQAVDILLSLLP